MAMKARKSGKTSCFPDFRQKDSVLCCSVGMLFPANLRPGIGSVLYSTTVRIRQEFPLGADGISKGLFGITGLWAACSALHRFQGRPPPGKGFVAPPPLWEEAFIAAGSR